ncbi:IclR family transcriptional regulator [Mesorhizobium sp. M1380]|uniref:IclR family transcriptional regulator n=1 Tax=Mesorhizobium sp. M1380 TaxID=2957093 RepID=UPI00333D5C69
MRKRAKETLVKNVAEREGYSTALLRGLEILRAFGPSDSSLGNLELMERTNLPKATVSRLTYTLAGLGYLVYNEVMGRYTLGPATVSLGYSALSSNAVIHQSRTLMEELAKKTGAAVAIGGRDQAEMVYLALVHSDSLVTLRLSVGSRLPIWNTAMGLAYFVGLDESAREKLQTTYPPKDDAERHKRAQMVAKALLDYERQGYVVASGTWTSYITSVGVPFIPKDGSSVVSFTCGGIKEIMDDKTVRRVVGPALVELRKSVEASLEGSHSPVVSPAAS